MDSVITIFSIGVILAYTWSVRGHFSSPKVPPGAWAISVALVLSTALLLFLTWTGEQPELAMWAGLVLEVASLWLFVAAILASRQGGLRFAFDPVHPHGLIEAGPYRYVRHPFYVSYIVFWTGWSVATWSPFAIVVPPAFLILYWLAARMEERNFAATHMSSTYAAYRERVGFFFPRLRF